MQNWLNKRNPRVFPHSLVHWRPEQRLRRLGWSHVNIGPFKAPTHPIARTCETPHVNNTCYKTKLRASITIACGSLVRSRHLICPSSRFMHHDFLVVDSSILDDQQPCCPHLPVPGPHTTLSLRGGRPRVACREGDNKLLNTYFNYYLIFYTYTWRHRNSFISRIVTHVLLIWYVNSLKYTPFVPQCSTLTHPKI